MTAIDRYIAICYPFTSHKMSSGTVHRLVLLAWSLSLVFSVPQMFIFSYQTNSYGTQDCWAMFSPEWTLPLYITIFTVLVYVLPTLILGFCYGSICVEVWRSSKLGIRLSNISKQTRTPGNKGIKRKWLFNQKTPSDGNLQEECLSMCGDASNEITVTCKFSHAQHCGKVAQSQARSAFLRQNAIVDTSIQHHDSPNSYTVERKSTVQDRQESCISFTNRESRGSVGISSAKIKTVKLTLTVILCYFLCWSPFFIAQMWAAWDETAPFYGKNYCNATVLPKSIIARIMAVLKTALFHRRGLCVCHKTTPFYGSAIIRLVPS